LPLENHAVDVGVAGLVLNFVPDKKRALDEVRRVVKPGGTIACYVWDYADSMQLIRHFWDAVAELFPDDAKRHEGKHFPLCKPQPLADLFRDADLRAVGTCALDAPTVFSDFEDYWAPFLRRQGPAGAYCASLSDDGRERLRGCLENALPINADGTIHLIARTWAVRGTA
jgi:SAM-dependent methyltransferase